MIYIYTATAAAVYMTNNDDKPDRWQFILSCSITEFGSTCQNNILHIIALQYKKAPPAQVGTAVQKRHTAVECPLQEAT